MAEYKLSYFNIKGLAEPIRYLLSYGGFDFEDIRTTHEEWSKVKSRTAFGQLPILEHDGKIANQSIAIARYVAKQVKLTGKNDWEDLEIDGMVDTINDLRLRIATYKYEQDEAAKQKKKETLFNEQLPFYLERFDSIAKKNNGHLLYGRLTWADIFLAAMYDYLASMVGVEVFSKYPNVTALRDNVNSLPKIKTYLEKRPKTDA